MAGQCTFSIAGQGEEMRERERVWGKEILRSKRRHCVLRLLYIACSDFPRSISVIDFIKYPRTSLLVQVEIIDLKQEDVMSRMQRVLGLSCARALCRPPRCDKRPVQVSIQTLTTQTDRHR